MKVRPSTLHDRVKQLFIFGITAGLTSCASRTPCQDAGPILWHKKFDGDKLCHQKQNSEGEWQNQGEFTWFYKNGIPALKGNYVDGKADGIWSEYNEKGEKTFERYFENGVEKTFMDPKRMKAMMEEITPSSSQPAPLSAGRAANQERTQGSGLQSIDSALPSQKRGGELPPELERKTGGNLAGGSGEALRGAKDGGAAASASGAETGNRNDVRPDSKGEASKGLSSNEVSR